MRCAYSIPSCHRTCTLPLRDGVPVRLLTLSPLFLKNTHFDMSQSRSCHHRRVLALLSQIHFEILETPADFSDHRPLTLSIAFSHGAAADPRPDYIRASNLCSFGDLQMMIFGMRSLSTSQNLLNCSPCQRAPSDSLTTHCRVGKRHSAFSIYHWKSWSTYYMRRLHRITLSKSAVLMKRSPAANCDIMPLLSCANIDMSPLKHFASTQP